MMETRLRDTRWLAHSLRLLLVGVVYALALRFTPEFASPFLQSQPLAIAAGVALASAALWGPAVVVALATGAWAAHAFGDDVAALAATAAAVTQGIIAAMLMRSVRASGQYGLETARDITLRFVLPALAASGGGALAAAVVHALAQEGTLLTVAVSAGVRFGADLAGMLIVAPIVFAFFARPLSSWKPRRWGLTVPMVATVALLLGAITAIAHWGEQRSRAEFEATAKEFLDRVDASLHTAMDVVNAVHGATLAAGRPLDRSRFEAAALLWLQGAPIVDNVAWDERVARADAAGYVERVRGEGEAGFRLQQRPGGVAQSILDADTELVVMRQFLSLRSDSGQRESGLGMNMLSIPEVRDTVLRALAGGPARVSPAFQINPPHDTGMGVVVYRPLRLTGGRSEGLAVATVFIERALSEAIALSPPGMDICVVDLSPAAIHRRLAGAPGCDSRTPVAGDLRHQQTIEFAGRPWQISIGQPLSSAVIGSAGFWNMWLFAWPGLLGASLLCTLLLVNTGRVRRIEAEVQRRTAELVRESQERRQAEAAAANTLRELRSIFDTVTVGVVQIAPGGTILNANPAYCELTGYSLDELRGMKVAALSSAADLPWLRAIEDMVTRGEPAFIRGDKNYLRKDGRIVPVSITVRPVRDADGHALYSVGAVQDLSETILRREAERARDQAEASNRAKSQFVARMSHELRTPLNAILGFAQLLDVQTAGQLPAAQRGWLTRLTQAGWHLLAMINDVLDLSRIESDSLELHIGQVDLRDVIETSVAMIDEAAARRGIRVSRELADDARVVLGDPVRVRQVLINLLSNAVKYNREAGRIDVRCRAGRAGVIEIEVTDTGLGMDAAQLETLFQPFNRLGRERSGVEGTGIGLTITKRLAELMGGQLRVRSTPNEGSVFTLELAAGTASTPAGAPGPVADIHTARFNRRRVLYIEDNETNIEIMRAMLTRRPQIELSVAMTGRDGLAVARRLMPDLVLLDLDLPDISGIAVLHEIRADQRLGHTPVIIVSAYAQADQVANGFDAGATDYVAKPLLLDTLLAAIDKELDAAHTMF